MKMTTSVAMSRTSMMRNASMSTSIAEVIAAGGYDLTTEQDARWLVSQVNQFEELVTKAEDLIEKIEEAESQRLEDEYNERWGNVGEDDKE